MSQPVFAVDSGPAHVALVGGRVAVVRAAGRADAAGIRALHLACSPETLRDRRLGALPRPTAANLAALLHPHNGRTLVACAGRADGEVIGMAQVIGGPPVAELAILVRDDAQGQGLGTILAGKAVDAALARGCTELVGYAAADNPKPLRLLQRLGLRGYTHHGGRISGSEQPEGDPADPQCGAMVTVTAVLRPDPEPAPRPGLLIAPRAV